MAGILTAPKSGRETRKDLEHAAIKAKHEAEKALKTLHSELANIIAQAKRQAKVAESDVKDDFQAAITEAVAAKEKVREILSALHEGESENRDLQKAIEDVNNSLEQLKKYLQAA
jgi:gas vesicle protein